MNEYIDKNSVLEVLQIYNEIKKNIILNVQTFLKIISI